MGMQRYTIDDAVLRSALAKGKEVVIYADAQERERVLREALEFITMRYEQTLAGKSVRDADEAISQARAALA